MTIKERLTSELKLAMKMKDKIAVEVIRLIKAKIIDAEKLDGNVIDDVAISKILVKAAKDQNSIIAYNKANRKDLVEKERLQLTYRQA